MAEEYLTLAADLTAVADAIRAKGGTADAMTFPEGFVSAVEAIVLGNLTDEEVTQINALLDAVIGYETDRTIPNKLLLVAAAKSAINGAIENKGVEIPDGAPFGEYSGYIDRIETGGGETVKAAATVTAYNLFVSVTPACAAAATTITEITSS